MTNLEKEIQELRRELTAVKAERDAAVADLEEISFCCNCKQVLHRDGLSVWCGGYADWFEWNDTCTEWEWRGVRHDEP